MGATVAEDGKVLGRDQSTRSKYEYGCGSPNTRSVECRPNSKAWTRLTNDRTLTKANGGYAVLRQRLRECKKEKYFWNRLEETKMSTTPISAPGPLRITSRPSLKHPSALGDPDHTDLSLLMAQGGSIVFADPDEYHYTTVAQQPWAVDEADSRINRKILDESVDKKDSEALVRMTTPWT
ncbi:hypothetical protein BGX31_010248 [Mortierella sp. GBA43]|nr:hypothetical protein BGX31_010248 [Mortierella sp. GBA43]